MMIITLQSRSKGATDETAHHEGEKIAEDLKEAGYSGIKPCIKKMNPVTAVSVIGFNSCGRLESQKE